MTSYTHTRITKEYLHKLQVLSLRNKRSATKELEVLIDQATDKQWRDRNKLSKDTKS